jgi:hypothetical protein
MMYFTHRVSRATTVAALAAVCAFGARQAEAGSVDFEELPLAPNSYWNGADGSGGFTSGGLQFGNNFIDYGGGWTFWDGWAYSNTTNTTDGTYANQYSALTGEGLDGSPNYAVAFDGSTGGQGSRPVIEGIRPGTLVEAYFTNTTYTGLVVRDGAGSPYAEKFGWRDNTVTPDGIGDGDYDDPEDVRGSYPDWLMLEIIGYDTQGQPLAESVEFYLADYRFEDDASDYVIDQWTRVDLSPLSAATRLEFALSSSDTDPTWGMNTPAYFAMDGLVAAGVPEPGSIALLLAAGMMLMVRRRRR